MKMKWRPPAGLTVEFDARLDAVTAVYLSVSMEAEASASRRLGNWLIWACAVEFLDCVFYSWLIFFSSPCSIMICFEPDYLLCLYCIVVKQTTLFWKLVSTGNQHFLIIMQIGWLNLNDVSSCQQADSSWKRKAGHQHNFIVINAKSNG